MGSNRYYIPFWFFKSKCFLIILGMYKIWNRHFFFKFHIILDATMRGLDRDCNIVSSTSLRFDHNLLPIYSFSLVINSTDLCTLHESEIECDFGHILSFYLSLNKTLSFFSRFSPSVLNKTPKCSIPLECTLSFLWVLFLPLCNFL